MTPERVKELGSECRSFEQALDMALREGGWAPWWSQEVWVNEKTGGQVTFALIRHLDEEHTKYMLLDPIGGPLAKDALDIWDEAKRHGAGQRRSPKEMEVEIARRLETKC